MRRLLFIVVVVGLTACGIDSSSTTPTVTADPQLFEGKRIFSQHCASCHSLSPDTVIVGPSLAGIATRAETRQEGVTARRYLELSILQPDAYVVDGFPNAMPASLGKALTGQELDAVVTYLLTLE